MGVVVRVSGMSCEHCVNAIQQDVSSVAGVTRVEVDLAAGVVTVTGDPRLTAIAAAIDEAGYEVTDVISAPQGPSVHLVSASCCCG